MKSVTIGSERRWAKGGWLLAAVGCLLLTASGHASEVEFLGLTSAGVKAGIKAVRGVTENEPIQWTTQYEWVTSKNGEPALYAINKLTGEVVKMDMAKKEWVLVAKPLLWEDVRKRQEEQEKENAARQARQEAAREAFWKALPQMSLKELVAKAHTISIWRCENNPLPSSGESPNPRPSPYSAEVLKQGGRQTVDTGKKWINEDNYSRDANLDTWRFDLKKGDAIVVFDVRLEECVSSVKFYLSNTVSDDEIIPAPATIIEDVKAEIKRQAEAQKKRGADAENK